MKCKYLSIIVFVFLLFCGHLSMGQNIVAGMVRDKEMPTDAIVGANVYFLGTAIGTKSDEHGHFEISDNAGYDHLVVSFVGYRSDTLDVSHNGEHIIVELEKNIELEEVVINERRKGVYHSKIDPMNSEKLTGHELGKAACCNLSESFETNASVDVAYSDAVTGAKQIQMLGLSGSYVQTICENMPSVRGMASPYGLSYIPGPWMESIQISKGTSSVINGYEAVTGQINVEYKKPDSEEKLFVNLFGSDAARFEVNANASFDVAEDLSTMVLLHAENQTMSIDHNDDDFMDLPLVQQINFVNRWEKHNHDGGHTQFGIKVLEENRRAGQVGAFGKNLLPNSYGIDIATSRYELFAKHGMLFDNESSIGIQFSGSYHNQDSEYGKTDYKGSQYNAYLNFIYQGFLGSDDHSYSTGLSFLGDWYDETLKSNNKKTEELTPGAFFQYTYNLHDHFSLLAGVRADYSSQYGLFVTPRLHAKANLREWLVVRGSIGKGFRTPMPLTENTQMLSSSRAIVIDDDLDQEEALNFGGNVSFFIPLGGRDLTITADFYRTSFLHQVIRDVDSDAHTVHFVNLDGESYSNAFQTGINYELLPGLTFDAAYRLNDVRQTVGGKLREVPLTSRYKALASLSYATPLNGWQIDFTTQFNGGGRMPDPDKVNPLWNAEFDPFTVMLGQVTKNFKNWSVYVGSENLTNFVMDEPIIGADDPWGNDFDGSMIWGPVHGRNIYAGIRLTIKGEPKEHDHEHHH